ncbi:MAG: hypothetical protein IPP43_10770 [Chitinophagaceae bacterium]|nr:hypothetical protein [Chitinophagaceae bacterium]
MQRIKKNYIINSRMKVISRGYVLGVLFSCILMVSYAQPQIGDATLQINAGGHLAQISESIVTSDGKYIITTSTDKTVCIWDAVNKKLVDQIRGPSRFSTRKALFSGYFT